MTLGRLTVLTAAALTAAAASLPLSPAEARPPKGARSSIPPYCVLITGPRGWPLPQICEFFDYRQCLQAAADMRGNCVINIDYPYEIRSAPGANWSKPPR